MWLLTVAQVNMHLWDSFKFYDPAGVNVASNHLVKYQQTLLKNRRFEESIKDCRNYTCAKL